MKKKTTITALMLLAMIVQADDRIQMTNHRALPRLIQHSDLAGLATVITNNQTRHSVEVNVKQWWLGSLPSNRFEIAIAGIIFQGPEKMQRTYGSPMVSTYGSDVVFFATTNEWKKNSSPLGGALFDWNYSQTFTNTGPACPPRLIAYPPTVFPVSTNSNFHVNILSNITDSIFFTRDKMQFYRAMRDAYGVDGGGVEPYKSMAEQSLTGMCARSFTEAELVEALNDASSAHRLRDAARYYLIHRFNWPANSVVPVP